MRIAVSNIEKDAAYIRHARIETLKSVRVAPHPSLVEPVACSKYVIAYDDRAGRAIGLGESAMLGDVYDSYNDTPYASIGDLNVYCPLNQMASMRTIYVEPEYRNNGSLFLALALYSAKLFYDNGARFATATTRAADPYLNHLYTKCCGKRVGTFGMERTTEPTSLFVFDLEKILGHRFMRRVSRYNSFDRGEELVGNRAGLCA